MKKYSLILASGSPRRKEFINWLDIPFTILTSEVEEISSHQDPAAMVKDLAKLKGTSVFQGLRKREGFGEHFFPVVLSADTLVVDGNEVLGKPKNEEDARRMLLQLAGKTHKVLTGVYLSCWDKKTLQSREECFFVETEVEFGVISPDILDLYIQSGDPMDKAGAYGIQGQALSFIVGIKGSYSNVVGLPLYEVATRLREFLGFENDQTGAWKENFY